jgi:type II secretory pathway pseudopilin PulG
MRRKHSFIKRFHACTHTHLHALTLIELVVVCAIIAVLVGIIWVVYHSIRERARITVCISNLKQIGIALTAYREDYDGISAEEGKENDWWELGLPSPESSLETLVPSYLPSKELLYCKGATIIQLPNIKIIPKYWYQVWSDKEPIPFRKAIALRGESFPIVIDSFHYDRGSEDILGIIARWVIVLRLNQKVERVDGIGKASFMY